MSGTATMTTSAHGRRATPWRSVGPAWRFLVSMRTGIALLVGLALVALVGTLVEQAPAGVPGDPTAYARWLASIRPRYGAFLEPLNALGLFSVFTSVWFTGLVVLLNASIIACSARRAPRTWRQATSPPAGAAAAAFTRAARAGWIRLSLEPADAVDALVHLLRSHHFRVMTIAGADGIEVRADRFRWTPLGSIVAHLSLVLIVGGAALGSALGFREAGLMAPVGTAVDVGDGTGLTILAAATTEAYDPQTGTPIDEATEVVLSREGRPVATATVRVNEPLRYAGVTYHQISSGPSVELAVADHSGAVTFSGGVPMVWGTPGSSTRVGRLSLPGQGLSVFAIAATGAHTGGPAAGQIELRVYRFAGDPAPIAGAIVPPGGSVDAAGIRVTYVRERRYAEFTVVNDPGMPLVWIGAIALVAGLSVVLLFPVRRIAARIRPTPGGSEVVMARVGRADPSIGEDITELLAALGPGPTAGSGQRES